MNSQTHHSALQIAWAFYAFDSSTVFLFNLFLLYFASVLKIQLPRKIIIELKSSVNCMADCVQHVNREEISFVKVSNDTKWQSFFNTLKLWCLYRYRSFQISCRWWTPSVLLLFYHFEIQFYNGKASNILRIRERECVPLKSWLNAMNEHFNDK